MTKVKTILAEFCSPKDILAINRLGLLPKEERESQPIPWRHRLPIGERRELVKSELRMSLRPPRSWVNTRDKVKAYETASNPKDSRMGLCLYNIHVRGDPSLRSDIKRIQRERSRLEASQEHTKHQFVSRSHSLNHEPLLLVERQPSHTVKTRAVLMKQHGVDPETLMKPSYMRPLQSRARTPSTLATIDAFSAETKKKRNVWEEAMDERDPPNFKSAARPYTRLSDSEVQQLRRGHAMHKPTLEMTKDQTPSRDAPLAALPKSSKQFAIENDPQTEERASSVFITQQATTSNRSFMRPDISPAVNPKFTQVDYSDSSSSIYSNLASIPSVMGMKKKAPSQNKKTVSFSGVRSPTGVRSEAAIGTTSRVKTDRLSTRPSSGPTATRQRDASSPRRRGANPLGSAGRRSTTPARSGSGSAVGGRVAESSGSMNPGQFRSKNGQKVKGRGANGMNFLSSLVDT